MRSLRWTTVIVALYLTAPVALYSQEEVLTSAFGNATDFNLFLTQVGAPKGVLKPERGSGAAGVGFELAFRVPGGFRRTLVPPSKRYTHPEGTDCRSRFARGELRQGEACADTTVVGVKRTRAGREVAYEEELKIDEFEWEVPLLTLEVAVGFSQAGAFVSRRAGEDIRVSLRESPFVGLSANYRPTLPVVGRLIEAHLGGRTGLVRLVGGRAFTEAGTAKLDGDAFQIGPVAGVETQFRGINLFVEGAYLWRNFKSVDWSETKSPGSLPRTLDFTGPSLAVGVSFEFKRPEEK